MRWMKLAIAWIPRIVLALLVFDVGYLVGIWPDWNRYQKNPVPESKFIEHYRKEKKQHPEMPALRWQPVPIRTLPDHLLRAIIVAEDSRFYSHSGFDPDAFLEAMEYNLAKKRVVYGASTISQQTVKNMFLSASRDPLRKWHEVVLTFFMERQLSKRRILELYVNAAEFGPGVFGVEAAARHYWGIPASQLSLEQSLQLASTLPAPTKHNPSTHTKFFVNHMQKLARHMDVDLTPLHETSNGDAEPEARTPPPASVKPEGQVPRDTATTPQTTNSAAENANPEPVTPPTAAQE